MNPFQPGAGARPPLLAGRDREKSLASELFDRLEMGRRPSQGVLFFGPRGNGKTSLLDEIADHARERCLRAEELAVSSFGSPEALIGGLQEKAGLNRAQFQGVQVAGAGISVQPGSPPADAADLLGRWIGLGGAPLVILLDEAHAIPAEPACILFSAFQTITRRELPFLLLAAGTPDAPRRIREAGTFTERMFRQIPVNRLPRDATLRALREPAEKAGRPITDDAAAWLAEQSQDYPYFIQLLGGAAWEATTRTYADEIGLATAQAGAAAIRPDIERFYSARSNEARERSVHRALRPLARLITEREGKLGDDDLDAFLEMESGTMSEAELLAVLTDLGVLWESPPGEWEMGIPSFANFLLRSERPL